MGSSQDVGGVFSRRRNSTTLIICERATTQHDDVTTFCEVPHSHTMLHHSRDEVVPDSNASREKNHLWA